MKVYVYYHGFCANLMPQMHRCGCTIVHELEREKVVDLYEH